MACKDFAHIVGLFDDEYYSYCYCCCSLQGRGLGLARLKAFTAPSELPLQEWRRKLSWMIAIQHMESGKLPGRTWTVSSGSAGSFGKTLSDPAYYESRALHLQVPSHSHWRLKVPLKAEIIDSEISNSLTYSPES